MTDMEIETFLTVLRCGSMTAAAQALYITQPTLSARLQTLEDEVGTPLFVRGKGLRRLELTDAGSRFLPLAQRWRKLTDEMRGIAAAEARTHFRIGAVYTANQYVLPPVYKRFLERDLPVALRVETLSSQQAQEAVTRRELDMAIVEDDVGFNPELQVTPLFRDDLLRGQRLSGAGGPPGPGHVSGDQRVPAAGGAGVERLLVRPRRPASAEHGHRAAGRGVAPYPPGVGGGPLHCRRAHAPGGPGQDLPLYRAASGPHQLSHRPAGGAAAGGGRPVSGGSAVGAAAAPGRGHLFLTRRGNSEKTVVREENPWYNSYIIYWNRGPRV